MRHVGVCIAPADTIEAQDAYQERMRCDILYGNKLICFNCSIKDSSHIVYVQCISLLCSSIVLFWSGYGSHRITPSNATKAIAFAGNALKKQGTKPLQYPPHPRSRYTATAASFHHRNCRCPSPSAPPMGSVIRRFFTTSDGYDMIQKIWAEIPPAQKLITGADRLVRSLISRDRTSYEPHQKKKNDRKRIVAKRPR